MAAPKPFLDNFATVQRNAITSWTLLNPRPEVVLFGEELGTEQLCSELDLLHEPRIAKNEFGTPLLNDLLVRGDYLAANGIICFVNSDVILMGGFLEAVRAVSESARKFLMVGQRCTVEIPAIIDFTSERWETDVRKAAEDNGVLDPPDHIDYFVFPKGLFHNVPPFAIGRPAYDNWLIWKALRSRARVIDATEQVMVIHQRHDFSHLPEGVETRRSGPETMHNRELAGGWSHFLTIAHASHKLTPEGMRRARDRKYIEARNSMIRRRLFSAWLSVRRRLTRQDHH